jgi:hypothetical protein
VLAIPGGADADSRTGIEAGYARARDRGVNIMCHRFVPDMWLKMQRPRQ